MHIIFFKNPLQAVGNIHIALRDLAVALARFAEFLDKFVRIKPVHDHLAWGPVGLYRGTQDEEIYARDAGTLTRTDARALRPGDFYALLPPRDDIHRVRTTSAETSVSLHLLTNDTGCVWRHAFDEHTGEETPFRSGYVNEECPPA